MDLQNIKTLCEKRGIDIKEVAKKIGMSEQNLHRCIRLNKMQAQDLEKVANILGVSITAFFGDGASTQAISGDGGVSIIGNNSTGAINACSDENSSTKDLRDMIELLKSQLKDKERIIKLMEK